MEAMNKINILDIVDYHVNNITELNALHYAAAVTLAGVQEQNSAKPNHLFEHDRFIDEKIIKIRKWLGRITAVKQGSKLTPKVKKYLGKETADVVSHQLKMKLAALCKKKRTRIANRSRFKANKLYNYNQKAYFSKLRNGDEKVVEKPPSVEGIQKYWGGLFGNQAKHNKEAEWLAKEREEVKEVEESPWGTLTTELISNKCKKLANWKSPGLDQVQNFWIKKLVSLHPLLAQMIDHITVNPKDTPAWMTEGRTTLIHKKGPTDQANNYRPITCLPTYYKLQTLIYTDLIYDHVITNEILPLEQKGIRRKARGCKDQLLLDKSITEDAKKRKRNLSVMWIDYKKAYDSIPHSWIIEVLKLYKINKHIINFITQTMKNLKTKVSLPHKNGRIISDLITFCLGIFQGDTLSPLIFCLALAPIRNILKRDNIGYTIMNTKVSNLLYIDDLKVYARNANEMERSRALIEEFSDDISMSFGLDKCAVVHLKAGKISNSPEVKGIPILQNEESYKYLGVIENDQILHDNAKVIAKKEFIERVRNILKTELTSKNTSDAIRTFAMPVLRYGFGVLKWTKAELRGIDRTVRKTLTKGKYHHPKSNTHRLHLSRNKGGRGMISAVDCHRQECTALANYIVNGNNTLSRIIATVEQPKKYGLLSFLDPSKEGTTESIDKEHEREMRSMKLHGDYFNQQEALPNIDLEASRKWINSPHLRFETESLLCAAQEQALNTKYLQTKIWGTGKSCMCRLCKVKNETVHHIISGCKMLAQTQYLYRHNQVAKYLHWNILRDAKIIVSDSWLNHKPTEIAENPDIKVLWDSYILTDKKVPHNRPDLIVHNKKTRECIIIDVAIPACHNVVTKEAEKISKYRDLEIEIQKCWDLKTVRTIPIVIGALGTVTRGIKDYLKIVSPNTKFSIAQQTALLGTAHILRNFLTKQ